MLHLLDAYSYLFQSWQVVVYEQEGETYFLKLKVILLDGSKLELKDYLFSDGSRKYAYHWTESDGSLRRRWDNAPHWEKLATYPHHVHIPDQDMPDESILTNLEDLLKFIANWLENGKII